MIEILTVLAAAATAAAPASTATIPDAQRVAAARDALDILAPPEGRKAFFDQAISSTLKSFTDGLDRNSSLQQAVQAKPEVRIVIGNFLQRQRDLINQDIKETEPAFNEAMARAYARRFTLDELKKLHAFFSQPVGRKYLSTIGGLLSDPEVAAWTAEMTRRTQGRMRGEVENFRLQVMDVGNGTK